MCFQHDEIIASMIEDIEQLTIACSSRVKPVQHLEQDDDDYAFVDASLERWADRGFPAKNDHGLDIHNRLEREADRILSA